MENNNSRGFTIVELIVSILILSLIMGFVWYFYFSSRETTRHTISQSKMQLDVRILLDNLELEMTSCYSFEIVDSVSKQFSFYSFTFTPPHLDDVFYDTSGNPLDMGVNGDSVLSMVKYEYIWNAQNKTVTKKRTPGLLFFLRTPMKFIEAPPTDARYSKMEKIALEDVADFDVRAYKQIIERDGNGLLASRASFITTKDANEASFITLRVSSKRDEVGNRRDEEVDILTKFYSNYKLAESANPSYFSSTDRNGRY